MKMINKLHAHWSKKEDDLNIHWPAGSHIKPDGHLLCSVIEPLMKELEKRGYDKKTLKFSIEPTAGNERFDII